MLNKILIDMKSADISESICSDATYRFQGNQE